LLPADEQPAFEESFRSLRSFLLFTSASPNNQTKVVLITSAIPKEGKTTVASNLARTLAMSGSRVLLVDADVRRGSVHQIFNVSLNPGLLEVLSQEVPTAQAIVPTTQPGLFILPAGESGHGNSDTFLRRGMAQLLHDLAAQYNYIVIDSAPVLATDDAACLGPSTDGVLMVVRASYTSARAAREALDRLRKRKVNVLGMVYNCAPASADYYCRYSRDYYAPREAVHFA
jgi:polysaccharide biosynthesis transport protein